MRVVLGDGLLGREIISQTGWRYFSRKKDGIDITMPKSYEYLLSGVSEVVNCVGYTNTWQNTKEPTWSINYEGVINLVDICNKKRVKLIHISTDYVYTHSATPAKETDIPIHFPNWYTYTKLLADAYIQARCKNYLIARCSFKPKPFPWDEAWTDLWGNFDYVDTIASIIIKLIEVGASGIYNVGTQTKSMYDLALQTRPDCRPILHSHAPFNITMNLDKLDELFPDYNI